MEKKTIDDLRVLFQDQYRQLIKVSLEIHKLQGRAEAILQTMESLIAEERK
jgi:hypothetical protein